MSVQEYSLGMVLYLFEKNKYLWYSLLRVYMILRWKAKDHEYYFHVILEFV